MTFDDINDAFIARISPTVMMEWFVQVMFSQGKEDDLSAIITMGDYVYAFAHTFSDTNPEKQHSILKLTYAEGKLQWAK